MTSININNKDYNISNISEETPILWLLRDHLNLTGTKFGCGVAQCGACTILLDGVAIRSCSTPLNQALNKKITTIENTQDIEIKRLQQVWRDFDVAQCGYCQPGQIMNASALLKSNKNPSENEIKSAMQGNICRCGTYNKILKAVSTVAKG